MTPAMIRRLRAALDRAFGERSEPWSETEAWALATAIEARGLLIVQATADTEPEPHPFAGGNFAHGRFELVEVDA